MTITRIFQTGFEWGNLLLEAPVIFSNYYISDDASVVSSLKKTGSYSLSFFSSGTYVSIPLGRTISQARTSFHFYHPSNPSVGNTPTFWRFTNGASDVITFQYSNPNIVVKAGGVIIANIASAAFAATSTWVHVSIDIKIHSTQGWVRLYVNETMIINYSGQTDQSSFSNFNRATIGNHDFWWHTSSNGYIYYDDIYIDDTTGELAPTFAEDRRFLLVTANNTGYLSEWTGLDKDTLSNHLSVNEVPPDGDLTRIETVSINVTDSFKTKSFTLPEDYTIKSINPSVIAQKDNGSDNIGFELGVRYNDTNYFSDVQPLKTYYSVVNGNHIEHPSGGTWTQEGLDNLEVIIRTQET